MESLSMIAALAALYGTYLNANQNRLGFYFWLVTNLFFSVQSLYAGLISQGLLFFAYCALSIKGLYTWKK